MKNTLILLLLFSASLVFAQDYRPSGRAKFIAPEGAVVHAMGQSGDGTVLAVGDMSWTDADDKATDGFIAYYAAEMTSSFDFKTMGWGGEGGLNDVCGDIRDGAWVVGWQLNRRGFRQGILQHMLWDDQNRSYYSDPVRTFLGEENEVNVNFNAICRLADDRLIIGGYHEYSRKRGGEKIVPVLYQYDGKRLDQLNLPELTVGASAAVIRLLPSSGQDEVAVITEYLTDDGEGDDRYREFLLRVELGGPRVELLPKWEIGERDRISCPGFSMSINDEIIATGTRLNPAGGEPWLGVAPIRAAAIEPITVESGTGNQTLGGNALLEGQLNTVSGTNRHDYSFIPDYTHLEEFLYYPDKKAYRETGLAKPILDVGKAGPFYHADFYLDTKSNLWLFGQRETRVFNYRPEAIIYAADESTLGIPTGNEQGIVGGPRDVNRLVAINEHLSIREMTIDFGNNATGFLPAGRQGQLRVALHNSGPEIYGLEAQVAVEGQARGVQFLSQKPSDSRGLRGVGRDKTVRFAFPIETTEEVSVATGARFVLQIFKGETLILEHGTAIVTKGDKYSGYKTIIDKNFGGNTSPTNPDRSGTGTFKIVTQITTARPLEAGDVVVKNKKVALNKGRGRVLRILPTGETNGYNYEVEIEVELDPALNEITFQIQGPGEEPIESDVHYVYYSDLPTLHYIGIAPDYSRLNIQGGVNKLSYNRQDVKDVADELVQNQGSERMYSGVATDLLTTVEETSTQNLRDYFALLASRVNDPTRPGYIAEDDLIVLHFAAHGGLKKKKYAILPSDYDHTISTRILDYERDILEPLLELDRRIVILIDACRNPLEDGSRGANDPDVEMMEKLFELHRDVEGIVTFAAASEGERAYEHDQWGNGLFTEALLEALRGATGYDEDTTPIMADRLFAAQPDGILTINELSKYLSRRVPGLIRQTTGLDGKQQHPSLIINRDSDKLPGDFPLFRLPERR